MREDLPGATDPPGLRVDLVRHGESVNNAGPVPVPDAPLTGRGRWQAERLGAAWRAARLDAVVCSPLWRALETAQPLVSTTGAPARGWPELVERNRSYPLEGRSPADVAARFPWLRFDPALEAVRWPAYPGRETEEETAARADAAVRRVGDEFGLPASVRAVRVALVGHQGFGGFLLQRWLRAETARFRQANGHVHTLEIREDRVTLVRANAPGYGTPGAYGSLPTPPVRPEAGGRELFLIRHGQSTGNLTGARVFDPPVTEFGQRQAERVAAALAEAGLTAVVCSPMVRALQTAVPVAARTGAPLSVWTDLVEFNGWEAYRTLPAAHLAARFPTADFGAAFPADGAAFPGPESAEDGRGRVRRVLRRLERDFPARTRVAVVAHGTFLGMMLAAAAGVAPDAPIAFRQDNACLHRLRWEDGRLDVLGLNDTSHLAGLD